MVDFKNLFKRNSKQLSDGLAPVPQQETRTIVVHNEALGVTGTRNFAGYPHEEYLFSILPPRQKADKYDEMRRGDPQVKMCLRAVKAPIMGANWQVEPYDINDPESVKDAELVEWVLFENMKKKWSVFLNEALTFFDFGFSVFEIIDGVAEHPEFGTVNVIQDLSWRSPRTIEKWYLDPKTGQLKSIYQIAFGDLNRMIEIPAEFLLVLTLEKEGSSFEGISALRCIYGNWLRKNAYLKLNAIGVEKFAIPTPIVKVPDGKEGTEQYANMVAALEQYCAHEKSWLSMPKDWEIDLKTNTYDPQKVEISIDNEDKRMAKAFLANFLELGLSGHGSQALSSDLSSYFLETEEHIAEIIADGLNNNVIPRLIQMNRGPRKGYPKICPKGISDRGGKELSEVLSNLVNGKILTPDDVLEESVRERYKLPEADPLTKRDIQPQPKPTDMGQSIPKLHEKMKRIYG